MVIFLLQHKIVVVPTKNACHFLPRAPNGDIAFSEFSAEEGGQIFIDEGFLLVLVGPVIFSSVLALVSVKLIYFLLFLEL
jgi:hypothetical protein